MNTIDKQINKWRDLLNYIRNQGCPSILPSSRRFAKDEWHPLGHKVVFRQTVKWPDGKTTRVLFSDIGVDREAAIGNSLRKFNTQDLAKHHPDAKALYSAEHQMNSP